MFIFYSRLRRLQTTAATRKPGELGGFSPHFLVWGTYEFFVEWLLNTSVNVQ